MKYKCSIPWTGFSNEPDGRAQPCCLYKGYITDDQGKPMYVQEYTVDEILNSKFMKELRQEFRDGEKPKGCEVCWADELNGYESKRIIYNTKIKHDPEIVWNEEPKFLSEFQLIINNSCNLKCRSCTPSHSTQWQSELLSLTGKTGYPMPLRQSGDEFGKLWLNRLQWYKNLRRLEVVGGEPFYVKQWHQIFYELIDQNYSKDIDLTFSTNCTLFYETLLQDICQNFKSVSIGLSIDGIEKTYEYLRHPAVWFKTYENMKRYKNLQESYSSVNLQINLTISWLNALQVTEIHEMIYKEFPNFSIWNNIVHNPQHLALWSAPPNLKKEIEFKWKDFSWDKDYSETMDGITRFMNSREISELQISSNLDILLKTDKFRKESLFGSMPYLKRFFE
jgi:sulfatase maturation enzyme AslB (radical SAM superfamily)